MPCKTSSSIPVQHCCWIGHLSSLTFFTHYKPNMTVRHSFTHFLLLPCVALLLLPLAGCYRSNMQQALRAATIQSPEPWPQLLAAYQPWFGNKSHMNVGYSSGDAEVLRKQIAQARQLGISGFVVNWYGPRKEFEDGNYAKLQKVAAESNFKVAIQYDEAVDSPGSATDAVLVDLRYAYDLYIGPQAGPSRDAYLRLNGRPLIFIFPKNAGTNWNQVRQGVDSWPMPDKPLLIYKDFDGQYNGAFDGFYAWVNPGKGGWTPDGNNWGEDYLRYFYTTVNTKFPDKIAVGGAWPGFDDRKAGWSRNRRINSRCGRTFEDTLRMFRAYYNDSHPLPFLLIDTWNDYEEGTAIEKGLPKC